MGDANACTAFLLDPELVKDILDTLTTTSLRVLERISDRLTIDQLSVSEDLAGKTGPLLGPEQVATFVKPYYRAVWEMLSSRGCRLFEMDSDGNFEPILDELLDCGLNAVHPCEPAAGMDMVKLRRTYGTRLALRGGIDKFVLQKEPEDIRTELEYKMQPLMREGGTVFGLDHRIPNGTPLQRYRHYVDLGREILGLPPRSPDHKGWKRMAF
jgi:uroporphyrinogen-III decarboxylase